MTDATSGDHVYQIVVTFDVVASTVDISCGGLAPQLVRVALELAADHLADVSEWTITAENVGVALVATVIPETDDDE